METLLTTLLGADGAELPRTLPPRVPLLDADPDLGASLEHEQWPHARAAALAPVFHHPPGPWQLLSEPDPASLGALILQGLIVLRLDVGARAHLELLGEGDVISRWAGVEPDLATPTEVTASVVSELRVALLDRRFSLRVARWPEIYGALAQRMIARSRRLSVQAAINAVPKIEERLDLTLWQLGYRFGRVTAEGLKLHLPLTHAQLAEMVAAQRPSVSTAVTRLEASGRVIRPSKHDWLLLGQAPARLAPLTRQNVL